MQILNDYEYHLEYKLLIYPEHSSTNVPKQIDVHFEINIRGLLADVCHQKKEDIDAMVAKIKCFLIPL